MTKTFNHRQFFRILGLLLLIETVFMLISALVALYYGEGDARALLITTAISATVGAGGLLIGRRADHHIGTREGFSIVAAVWVVFSLFGMLPFIISGKIASPIDAFFETMSGFTTTGATILTNVETLPHGLQFWRCITQWIGGMGIVVMSMALLPFIGGGMQLFAAEVPGPTYDKLQPRMRSTAQRIWGLYLALTAIEMLLLWAGGMPLFDAICHAFTTMGSGGYTTHQDSIAHWTSPFVQYTIVIFMLITGINYTLLYLSLVKRQFGRFLKDEELRAYLLLTLFATILITIGLGTSPTETGNFESTFRQSLFQVSSIISTTGFVSADYTLWLPILQFLLILLMFVGGSAGSTSGGMKVVRLLLLAKNSYYEMRRLIHPNAVLPVRINGHVVQEKTINSIHAFIILYVGLIIVGTSVVALSGLSITESAGAVLACISNIGPALGSLGPMGSYAALPCFVKIFLAFVMLVGRLELFTVLILFSPGFWKK